MFYFFPLAPDKDNQDACISMPVFGNPADQQAFFAIFDGHGRDGHYCSRFAKDNVIDSFCLLSIHILLIFILVI